MTPDVSVLMPCRNAGTTITDAAVSILQQADVQLELIIVDDGSSDDSLNQLGAIRTDPRVRIVPAIEPGIVGALNTGLALVRAPFMARMDADDIAPPARLSTQLSLLHARPEIVACGTAVRYFPDHAVRDGARRYESWINAHCSPADIERNLFIECPIAHPTLCARTPAVRDVGGYHAGPWPEDYDLVLRLWVNGGRFANAPEPVHQWREHAGRLSRSDGRYGHDAFRRCKIRYLRYRTGGRSLAVWGAGPIGKAFAREAASHGHQTVAFIDVDPRKIGNHVGEVPVIGPDSIDEVGSCYIVSAVGTAGARELIRERLVDQGLNEPGDWCAVA